jgi:adenine/guanine phosphoribosyltransferase-like PRPP-binding protein
MNHELKEPQQKERRTQVDLPSDLYENWQIIRKEVEETAQIHPKYPDFVMLDWINRNGQIDATLLRQMSEIAAYMLDETVHDRPTHVVGIAESGIPFSREVAKKLGLEHSIVYKANNLPDDFDPHAYKELVALSYTLNQNISFYVPQIEEGAKIVVVDDVIAFGGIGKSICEALSNTTNEVVGMATSFDKVWQRGVVEIEQAIQVPVVSVIRIAGIKEDRSGINLMPEEQALSVRRF